MNKAKLINTIIVHGMLLYSIQAVALDAYFSGFGTVGISCFSNNDADYRRDDVPVGPGRTQPCSAELDSKLGVQGDFQFSDTLGSTFQVTAIHNSDDDFMPQLTLANLRWQYSDNWRFRIGRMQNPNFIYSEYRNVNYAQPWARPPGEVYNMLPTFLHDGVEVLYRSHYGDWEIEYQAGLAQSDFDFPISNTSDSLEVSIQTAYLNFSAENGPWLFKVSIAPGRADATSPNVESLLAALRGAATPEASALANEIEIKDKRYTLYSLGFRYDDGKWLFDGEFLTRPTKGFVQQPITAYLSAGRRLGPWTPYAVIARLDGCQDDAYNTLPAGDPLYNNVEALLSSTHDLARTTLAVGVARELNDQATLKIQADFIRPDNNSWADYINHHETDYDFSSPGTDTLLSISVDFVF